ncbi:AAA family ATPase [Anaerorhabdus sp.]|uniref:ATP-dependent nuclease n=1 Tax=Anaerorhabdus sp. TaxID=1872524 RepID=UPI002B1FB1A7|nr:AAA family ATPase [Anaerorhabdus sp.]MEA4875516.1 AAA family ATPase [Anaerorhabdus sp.]
MTKYIKTVKFEKYKRLEDLTISFSEEVNIIAGTNGTCKSSILHIISNAYQALKPSADKKLLNYENNDSIAILNSILISVNPKIETLNRGSKAHNDPAPNTTPYYTIEFTDDELTKFRKHESSFNQRFRVIPYYKKGTKQSLPKAMIAYLGIKRLVPIGEINNDDALKYVKKNLSNEYKKEIATEYSKFTGRNINNFFSQDMAGIKKNFDFETDDEGFDSNTVSAGEDNLLIIITTLVCLKYFKQSLKDEFKDLPTILLIDEFDATLHPEFQLKLFDLIKSYSTDFKIQIVFTTHSLTLLEHALRKKTNVVYLIDDVHKIKVKESVDIYDIHKYLKNQSLKNIYSERKIPLFTEDNETRLFLDIILEKIINDNPQYSLPFSYFHYLNENFGCEILKNIFVKDKVVRNSIRSICVVDGDQQTDLTGNFIALPGNGNNNPERIAFKHALKLLDDTSNDSDTFWEYTDDILGIPRKNFKSNIAPQIEERNIEVEANSSKTNPRVICKKLFNKDLEFYKLVLKNWANQQSNQKEIELFLHNLECAFRTTAPFNNIGSSLWPSSDN